MLFKLLWAVILFLLGLSALNNYFKVFTDFIFFEDRMIMLLNGIFLIIAGLVIFLQKILLRFHEKF